MTSPLILDPPPTAHWRRQAASTFDARQAIGFFDRFHGALLHRKESGGPAANPSFNASGLSPRPWDIASVDKALEAVETAANGRGLSGPRAPASSSAGGRWQLAMCRVAPSQD
jgi:hypothetical protein